LLGYSRYQEILYINGRIFKKNTGDIIAKKGYQEGHSNKITNLTEFEKFIIANKDKTLKELSRPSDGKFSSTTVWRGLKALGYS
jgi:hypothetical protein